MTVILLKILSGLSDVAYNLIIELVASRLDRKLPPFISNNLLKKGKSAYKKNLIAIANVMPFLYRDLKVEVLNDFANIEIERIALETLKYEERLQSTTSLNEKLRDSKKVLFIGNAGMGKTTFQRHSILKILTNRKEAEFLYSDENPLPFYIPLKAVDDSQRFPILNYILNNRILFSEEKKLGLKQLIKITRKQGVFLFIDGYDEIQFLGGAENFVQDELNLIVKSTQSSTSTKIPQNPTEKDFYNSLSDCRVWLSSRKEFYRLYPLNLESKFALRQTNLMAGVILKGIFENRFHLIQNIFKKYPNHENLLDAKYFIRQIDNADDKGMIDLSYNPLFLTIMCYVYIRKVIDKQDYKVKSSKNFYDLITECINLLLIDLDKNKAIGLSEPAREAELYLRNTYVLEKKEFLPYFAVELFFDSKPVFGMEYLNSKVEQFFELNLQFESREEIIGKFKSDPQNKTNFAFQLILQGLFVLVDKQNEIDLFDFPHKRFREILAIQYFEKYGYQILVKNVEKENLSELWVVIFQISQNREELFLELLRCLKSSSKPDYINKLIINCLKQVTSTFSGSKIFEKFISECIESNSSFNLSSELLKIIKFQFSGAFSSYIHKNFHYSLEKKKLFSLSICCYLISKYNNVLMEELVNNTLYPLLKKKSDTAITIILTYPKFTQFIKKDLEKDSFTRNLIYITKISSYLSDLSETEIFPEKDKPESCYILTNEIIEKFVKNASLELNRSQLGELNSFLIEVKGKLFFDDRFIDKMPEFIEPELQKNLIENSKLNYFIYEEIMKKILTYNKNLAQQMTIFKE